MEGKYFAERQKECLIHSFESRGILKEEIQRAEQSRAEQKREVVEKDQQITCCRERKKFVPVVALIPLFLCKLLLLVCPVEAVIAPGTLCMQPLELQV